MIDHSLMYSSWLDLLQSHFFPAYYIPTLEEEARASTSFSIHSNYVFNRGIFKDVLGSTLIYPDYQYRCNQVFFLPNSHSLGGCHLYCPLLVPQVLYNQSFTKDHSRSLWSKSTWLEDLVSERHGLPPSIHQPGQYWRCFCQ